MNTNQGYAYEEDQASPYDRGTIAAIFDTREDAKYALQDLHDAGFHKTWMGVTSAESAPTTAGAGTQVETAEGGFGASLARFFGESGADSLYDALTKRGVPHSDALALDHGLHAGGAVITVEAKDRYDEAIQILKQDSAQISSSTASGALGAYDEDITSPASGTAATAGTATAGIMSAPDPTAVGNGTTAQTGAYAADDTDRTLQLREERLSVDKERVSAGEATLGKRVVTQDASVDVPVMHEELFVERRPVGNARPATGTIGADETIRIPLMREQVVVDKRTIVREEVAIGKRAVTGTERVDGTVRHEELVVDDTSKAVGATTGATSASTTTPSI